MQIAKQCSHIAAKGGRKRESERTNEREREKDKERTKALCRGHQDRREKFNEQRRENVSVVEARTEGGFNELIAPVKHQCSQK